jgi:hypothetical protein
MNSTRDVNANGVGDSEPEPADAEAESTDDAVTRFESMGGSPAESVVAAIATAAGTDPLDLPPLNDAVDADALNAIFADTRGSDQRSGSVAFEYSGYEVTVDGDGRAMVVKR